MNRYVSEGIARDLEAGKRVIVIASAIRPARLAFEELAAAHPWQVVRSTAGVERIESASGGVATFHSALQHGSVRGLQADVVAVVDGFEGLSLAGARRALDEIRPIGAEIINCS